jgi:hypothetical protein
MSQQAKKSGFIVSMVPPQSYLDPSTTEFNRNLTNAYTFYHPEFHYHGMNVYAALLAKYGQASTGTTSVPTFDLVDVQLYESWAPANYHITTLGVPASEYLISWTKSMLEPFEVRFGDDPDLSLPTQKITIAASQLIVGFSFGSRDGSGKSVFIPPAAFGKAYRDLPAHQKPRGAMFWNADIDGRRPTNGTDQNISLVTGLNAVLKVR